MYSRSSSSLFVPNGSSHNSQQPSTRIQFQKSGRFTSTIEQLINKANRAYFVLRQNILRRNITNRTALNLWDIFIKPIILYGCEIWYPFETIKRARHSNYSTETLLNKILLPIEKLNTKLCKHTLGVHSKTPNIAVLAELGRPQLAVECISTSIAYYTRLKLTPNINRTSLVNGVMQNTTANQVLTDYCKLHNDIMSERGIDINAIIQTCSNNEHLPPNEIVRRSTKKIRKLSYRSLKEYSQENTIKTLKLQQGKLYFYS